MPARRQHPPFGVALAFPLWGEGKEIVEKARHMPRPYPTAYRLLPTAYCLLPKFSP